MRALAIVLLLAGCSLGNVDKDGAGKAVVDLARARLGGEAEAQKLPQLTRAMLAAQDKPLIRARLPKVGFETLAVEADIDGPTVTFLSTGGQSFSYRGGVLIATRGLGPDMMALATAPMTATPYRRSIRRLNGENQLVDETATCTTTQHGRDDQVIVERVHRTIRIEETCKGPEGDYRNIYWAAPGGRIWKSRQWLNAEQGYLETELLIAR